MDFLKKQKQYAKDVLVKGIRTALLVEDLNDPELQEWRYDRCKTCPFYNAETDQCGICSCFMAAKTTLRVNRNPKKFMRSEVTHCPVGNWDDKEVANIYRKIDGLPLLD